MANDEDREQLLDLVRNLVGLELPDESDREGTRISCCRSQQKLSLRKFNAFDNNQTDQPLPLYLDKVHERRVDELENLANYTGDNFLEALKSPQLYGAEEIQQAMRMLEMHNKLLNMSRAAEGQEPASAAAGVPQQREERWARTQWRSAA